MRLAFEPQMWQQGDRKGCSLVVHALEASEEEI